MGIQEHHTHEDGSICECFDLLKQFVEQGAQFGVRLTEKLKEVERQLVLARNGQGEAEEEMSDEIKVRVTVTLDGRVYEREAVNHHYENTEAVASYMAREIREDMRKRKTLEHEPQFPLRKRVNCAS